MGYLGGISAGSRRDLAFILKQTEVFERCSGTAQRNSSQPVLASKSARTWRERVLERERVLGGRECLEEESA